MVTCNGQWCVRLPYGAMLRNTIDSFMAIIRHFEVARETGGDGCQRALWVILREAFSTWRQNSSPKTIHFDNHLPWSPAQPQRGELWGCWGNWIKFRPQSNPTVQFDTTQKQSIWSYSQRVPRAWTCLIRLANFQDCQSCSSRIRAFYRWATLTM